MHLAVHHERVHAVDREIFLARFAPDCLTHLCRCLDEGGQRRLDACCQHGCDLELDERDAILARAGAVASILEASYRDPGRWFDASDPEHDPDGATWVRTATRGADEASGCVFLAHDGRGCALHRAALEHHFTPGEIKPVVCRLYPMTLGDGILCLSDDFLRYSCSEEGGPTVYRLQRNTLGEIFGGDLIQRLDGLERSVRRGRLPVVARL